jgi:hypothetical protein
VKTPDDSLTTLASRLLETGKSLVRAISSPKTRSQFILTSSLGSTPSTSSSKAGTDMPAVQYYTVTRTQRITVASAYGEVNAIRAGVAAMDGDLDTLNDLMGNEGRPEGHTGPVSTVRGKHETVKIEVEVKEYA